MRRYIMYVLAATMFMMFPLGALSIEEKTLPPETAPPRKAEDFEVLKKDTIVFNGYINSKDITVVADVMGCVYNLCRTREDTFCSDEQGALIVSGSDTGRVIDIIKMLDEAIEKQAMVQIYLSKEPYYAGVRRIVDVQMRY